MSCDLCGRQLELAARFCDLCGHMLAVEEGDQQAYAPVTYPPAFVELEEAPPLPPPVVAPQPPPSYETVLGEPTPVPSTRRVALFEQPPPPAPRAAALRPPPLYEIVLGEAAPRPSTEAGERPVVKEKGAEPVAEPKPAEPSPPIPVGKRRHRLVPPKPVRITRKVLALSLAAVIVIGVVAVAFLQGPSLLVGLIPTTETQTLPQTSTTQATGPVLQVQIDVVHDPVTLGTTQLLIVSVRDPTGNAVSNASVHVEVLYPSGQKATSDGVTRTNGQYLYGWYVPISAGSGTVQVTASATKSGYQLGQSQATFQATAD